MMCKIVQQISSETLLSVTSSLENKINSEGTHGYFFGTRKGKHKKLPFKDEKFAICLKKLAQPICCDVCFDKLEHNKFSS